MIRTEYKQLTEAQKHYIETGKELLNSFILHVDCTTPDPQLTKEKLREWAEAKEQAILKATEAGFWFTQMETT